MKNLAVIHKYKEQKIFVCKHHAPNEKRCYDVTDTGQEATQRRHLASAHQGRPASMHAYRMTFSVVWRAGLRRPDKLLSIG